MAPAESLEMEKENAIPVLLITVEMLRRIECRTEVSVASCVLDD